MEHKRNVVLALYPNSTGFGYAFMEKMTEPWECGVAEIKPINNWGCMRRIKKFIKYYHPTLILMQDVLSRYSLKSVRVRSLMKDIAEYATANDIEVKWYSRQQIRDVFEVYEAKSKYEIAQKIIEWLPQFKDKLPEIRKPWMEEDFKMGMFDALSLAVTHFYMTK